MPDPAQDHMLEIARLAECGPLKTWSVVVTILGDLLRDPDDRIHGRTLAALTGPMGIADPALRVALHRLKKDGWIQSARDGRESTYWLSESARAETEAMRARIYGTAPASSGPVHLLLLPGDAEILFPQRVESLDIGPRMILTDADPSHHPAQSLALSLPQTPLPDWITDVLCAPAHRAEYRHLTEATQAILAAPRPADPVHAAVLRMLILHHWRRLHLRHSTLADALLPADWEGSKARRAVTRAFDHLPRPALDRIAAAPRNPA